MPEVSSVLHKKYRPAAFDEVIGQDHAVSSLQKIIERKSSQAFLFLGPAGLGKTSLARITALAYGCLPSGILEIPAAIYTGVDAMRQVQETLQYKPFGKGYYKAIIVDEAHRLSGQAFDSMLKAVEEPPAHVLWLFCTTEPNKVPAAIKTRCSSFTLKPVDDDTLRDHIDWVCKEEGFKASDQVRGLVVRYSDGSPRQALVNLELCADVTDRKIAADLLRTAIESDASRELCQLIVNGRGSWAKAAGILEKLKDENPEGIRIQVCLYIAKALQNAKDDRGACHLLRVLEAFSVPYNAAEKTAPLLVSVGQALFGGG